MLNQRCAGDRKNVSGCISISKDTIQCAWSCFLSQKSKFCSLMFVMLPLRIFEFELVSIWIGLSNRHADWFVNLVQIIKNVMSILWTVLPGNTDIYWRRVLKACIVERKLNLRRSVVNAGHNLNDLFIWPFLDVPFFSEKWIRRSTSFRWHRIILPSCFLFNKANPVYGLRCVVFTKCCNLQVVEYVDKVAKSSKSSFFLAAQTIFTAKVSGTFSRCDFIQTTFSVPAYASLMAIALEA